ncbi:MAG TPA: hypothetical protein VMT52_09575 [Planctomycetota bacterium]|nr:hypothetical protein [Planctomycetota bacterium]
MGRRSLPLAAILLVSLFLPQDEAAAQATAKKRRVTDSEVGDDKTVTLSFSGGTVRDYIDLLRAQDEYVNIVASGQVESVEMGAVSLKRVSLQTALELIQATAGEGSSVMVRSLGRSEAGGNVYVLSPRGSVRPQGAEGAIGSIVEQAVATPKSLQVFSLRKLTRAVPGFAFAPPAPGRGADDDARRAAAVHAQKVAEEHTQRVITTVLTALETALDFQDPSSKDRAVIKFHTDSGLLLAQGTEEQINLIREVLDMLAVGGPEEAQALPILGLEMDPNVVAELRDSIVRLTDEVAKLRAEVEQLKASPEGEKKR